MPWQKSDWAAKRAELLNNMYVPDVLYFTKVGYSLAKESESVRRYVVVRSMLACAALGSKDSPKGRREAYCEAVFPFDWDIRDLNRRAVEHKDFPQGNNGTSSCGTFIRGQWQLMGGGEDTAGTASKKYETRMHQSYGVAEIFKSLAIFAYNCGALHGNYHGWFDDGTPALTGTALEPADGKAWDMGDVLFFEDGNSRHVITLAEKPRQLTDDKGQPIADAWVAATVEGGKGYSGDGLKSGSECEGIQTAERTLRWKSNQWILSDLRLPLVYWVSFGPLVFTDPEYFVAHRGPSHPEATKGP